jgi:poly(A) polymerase
MRVLEQELFIQSKYYQKILSIIRLAGGVARIVGGAVRDAIIAKPNYDVDIATNLLPQQIIDILSKANIKVIPTGIKYGTVTALIANEKFEITTLRKDIKCNGRYAAVSFTDDFYQDAIRRDFTINALSYCPFARKIYDYTGGLEDLSNSRLVFIGPATERIQEDFLRILRFFRFSCDYAKQLDIIGLNACIQLKEKLRLLSKERIKWEMDKLIISNNSPDILKKMFDNEILSIILPVTQLNKDALLRAISLTDKMDVLKLFARYSLLFYHINNLQLSELLNLKFSRQEATKIISIIRFIKTSSQKVTETNLRRIWYENDDYLQYLIILVSLSRIDFGVAREFLDKYNSRPKAIFPLTGYDLQKVSIRGKEIGILMNKLKKSWIESDFTFDSGQLLNLLENHNED